MKRGGPPRTRPPRADPAGTEARDPPRTAARSPGVQRAGPGRNRAVFVPPTVIAKNEAEHVANASTGPRGPADRGAAERADAAGFPRPSGNSLEPRRRRTRRERRRICALLPRWIRGGSRMFMNGAGGCDGRVSSVRATPPAPPPQPSPDARTAAMVHACCSSASPATIQQASCVTKMRARRVREEGAQAEARR